VYYAHYDPETGEIQGYYTPEVHAEIPTPNIELTEQEWQTALETKHIVVDNKLVKYVPPPPTLEQVKARQIYLIKNTHKIYVDDVTINTSLDFPMPITATAIQSLSIAVQHAASQEGSSIYITDASNVVHSNIELEAATTVLAEMESAYLEAHKKKQDLRESINKATTVEEAKSFTWDYVPSYVREASMEKNNQPRA
jgi:hypothetical protein